MRSRAGSLSRGGGSRWRLIAGVAVAVIVACAAVLTFAQLRDGRTSTDAAGRYVPSDAADPAALVGVWYPRGVDSLDGRLLEIGPGEFAVFDDFCKVEGAWRASSSGLLATFYSTGGTGKCDDLIEVSGTWFAGISWLDSTDGQVELLNRSGATILTLEPAPEGQADGLGDPGQGYLSGEPVPPIPFGVEVPTPEQLVDIRWVPSTGEAGGIVVDGEDGPFLEFGVDNYWQGSDGCNDQGGSWALHPETGEWLTTGGASTTDTSTAGSCKNVPVAEVVTGSSAVGLNGDELVFYDADGTEVGRFIRG